MAKVTLKNLVKQYGSLKVVNELSLEVQDKEFAVLVGPSGCGKSTALRMIAGLESVSSGEIYIGDALVNDLEPKDRDIAMVFQNYALYPHMTVRENMGFGLKIRKLSQSEIDVRVQEASDILGLNELLDRKPKELSGGQRQRVAVGRAIVRKPKVFLFDEPLSNLDAKLRVAMRAEISKLHKRLGATMIYVTHDQVEAMTMADRIFIMSTAIRATSACAPQVKWTKISDPSNSTTSAFAVIVFPSSLPGWCKDISSGRTPKTTSLAPCASRLLRKTSGIATLKLAPSMNSSPFSETIRASKKFIAGEPMKPATNRLAGCE